MASEFHGQRMSDYADIDSAQLTQEEKDYYKEHALVTAFGKTDGDASTGNSNYNVKLSEISKKALPPIAADDKGKVLTVDDSESLVWGEVSSSQPNYGAGLSYDADTNTLAFSYDGSGGGLVAGSGGGIMKVKAGVGIDVNDDGVSIKTQAANDGDVLTYHSNGSKNAVEWQAIPIPKELVAGNGISIVEDANSKIISADADIVNKSVTVETGSTDGSVTLDNYKYNEIATVPADVTALTINVPAVSAGKLQECAFQFDLPANAALASVTVKINSQELPMIAPSTFVSGKIYQGTSVNGLVTIAEFPAT